jgi:hypothetical protein
MTSESRDLWKDHNSLSQPGCLKSLSPRSEGIEAGHLGGYQPPFHSDDVARAFAACIFSSLRFSVRQ